MPGLVAVAQSTQGSVENVEAIASGALESALVQADIVYWAYHGTGLFQDQGPLGNLRAIANLFPSTVHIVVRGDSFITDIAELRGKRISLGEDRPRSLTSEPRTISARLRQRSAKSVGASRSASRSPPSTSSTTSISRSRLVWITSF